LSQTMCFRLWSLAGLIGINEKQSPLFVQRLRQVTDVLQRAIAAWHNGNDYRSSFSERPMFLDANTMGIKDGQQGIKNKNFLCSFREPRGRCWFFPRNTSGTTKAGGSAPEKW
jgi:hypothetical protein